MELESIYPLSETAESKLGEYPENVPRVFFLLGTFLILLAFALIMASGFIFFNFPFVAIALLFITPFCLGLGIFLFVKSLKEENNHKTKRLAPNPDVASSYPSSNDNQQHLTLPKPIAQITPITQTETQHSPKVTAEDYGRIIFEIKDLAESIFNQLTIQSLTQIRGVNKSLCHSVNQFVLYGQDNKSYLVALIHNPNAYLISQTLNQMAQDSSNAIISFKDVIIPHASANFGLFFTPPFNYSGADCLSTSEIKLGTSNHENHCNDGEGHLVATRLAQRKSHTYVQYELMLMSLIINYQLPTVQQALDAAQFQHTIPHSYAEGFSDIKAAIIHFIKYLEKTLSLCNDQNNKSPFLFYYLVYQSDWVPETNLFQALAVQFDKVTRTSKAITGTIGFFIDSDRIQEDREIAFNNWCEKRPLMNTLSSETHLYGKGKYKKVNITIQYPHQQVLNSIICNPIIIALLFLTDEQAVTKLDFEITCDFLLNAIEQLVQISRPKSHFLKNLKNKLELLKKRELKNLDISAEYALKDTILDHLRKFKSVEIFALFNWRYHNEPFYAKLAHSNELVTTILADSLASVAHIDITMTVFDFVRKAGQLKDFDWGCSPSGETLLINAKNQLFKNVANLASAEEQYKLLKKAQQSPLFNVKLYPDKTQYKTFFSSLSAPQITRRQQIFDEITQKMAQLVPPNLDEPRNARCTFSQ